MSDCPECGESFNSEHGMKIHHKLSHGFSLAKQKSACTKCGDEFEYYTKDKRGLYCEDCADNSWGNENLVSKEGSNNPNWSGGKPVVKCSSCGKEIKVKRDNNRRYENHFCSSQCESNYRSEKYSGKDNPRYIDGESSQRNYGKGWKQAKKKVRERDNNECQVCGKSKDEAGKNLPVHHIKPVRTFSSPEDAHFLDNLITLCPKHHQEVECGNRKI